MSASNEKTKREPVTNVKGADNAIVSIEAATNQIKLQYEVKNIAPDQKNAHSENVGSYITMMIYHSYSVGLHLI